MADIFDQLATEQAPTTDIFDQLAAEKPKRNFIEQWAGTSPDELATAQHPYLGAAMQTGEDVITTPAAHFANQFGINFPRAIAESTGTSYPESKNPVANVLAKGSGIAGAFFSPANKITFGMGGPLASRVVGGAVQGAMYAPKDLKYSGQQLGLQAILGGATGGAVHGAEKYVLPYIVPPVVAALRRFGRGGERLPAKTAVSVPQQAPLEENPEALNQWMSREGAPVAVPNATGQFDFIPGDLNYADSPELKAYQAQQEASRAKYLAGKTVRENRDQVGEQLQFDFTKGPEQPPLIPKVMVAQSQLGTRPQGAQMTLPELKNLGSGGRPFNDMDLSNPIVVSAIKNDPMLSEAEKAQILSQQFMRGEGRPGPSPFEVPPQGQASVENFPAIPGKGDQFDFIRGPQPAAAQPLGLQDIIAKYRAQGLSAKGAEKMAKSDLGIQDVVPEGPAKPMPETPPPGQNPLFDRWHADTQNLLDSFDTPTISRKEREGLSQVVFDADTLVNQGKLPAAIAKLEELRGKLDDESFNQLEDIVNKYKKTKEPLIIPEDVTADLAEKAAKADMKASGLDPDVIIEPPPKSKKGDALGNKGTADLIPDLTPEQRATLDKWKKEQGEQVMRDFRKRGESLADWLEKTYPSATAEDRAMMAQGMQEMKRGNKIENLNLRQYPEEQQQQIRTLFQGQEEGLKTTPISDRDITAGANKLETLPVTEAIKRNKRGQTAMEIRRRDMNEIAKMKAIAEDPKLSAQEIIQRILKLGIKENKKIKTEMGTALGAMRTPLEAQQQQLVAMRKIVERLREDPRLTSETSRVLIKDLRTQFPDLDKSVTGSEIFKYIFRNFLINSPRTLSANAVSGYGNVALRPLMRTLEVTAAKARSLLSGVPTTATYKEIGAMLKGLDDAYKGVRLPDDLHANTYSDKYNISPLATVAAASENKGKQLALGVADKAVGAGENIMRRTDDHVKNVLGMMEWYASKARGENAMVKDSPAAERIRGAQSRGTFQDEMSELGKWVANIRNYWSRRDTPTATSKTMDVLTYAVQPFIQTIDRITAAASKTSILGGPSMLVKGQFGGYKGAFTKGVGHNEIVGEAWDRDIAATAVGVPLFLMTAKGLMAGNITGAAPSEPKARETFYNAGKIPYAFKLGNRWIAFRDMPEPMATAIQINAALIQGWTEAKGASKKGYEAGMLTVKKLGNMLLTKQYLGGMNSVINTATDKNADTVNELPITTKVVPALLVPSAVKDVGVIKDTLLNRPRVMADTAIEATKRRAGMTGGMVPELNTFGEEVTHPMMGQVSNDPARALAEKFPPPVLPRKRTGVELAQQEYHDMKKSVGTQRKMVYETLANSQEFMSAPPGLQQLLVEDMVAAADEIGSLPRVMQEMSTDPAYYDRELRILLQKKYPGDPGIFPFSQPSLSR